MDNYRNDEEIRNEIKEEAEIIKTSRKRIKKLKNILKERNNGYTNTKRKRALRQAQREAC